MNRIGDLINLLKEQFEQNADAARMQITIQLIQSELSQMQSAGPHVLGTSKVSVILPQRMNIAPPPYEKPLSKPVEKSVVHETKETLLLQEDSVSIVQKNGQLDMVFDPMLEIPTLSHQLRVREVNEN